MQKFIAVVLALCVLCCAAQAEFKLQPNGILTFFFEENEDIITYGGTSYHSNFCGNAALRSDEFLGEALLEDENCNSWHFLENNRFSIMFRREGTLNGLPSGTFFCAEDDLEAARAYYGDSANWDYYISIGYGHPTGADFQPEYRPVPDADIQKFQEVESFSNKNAYNPFSSQNREDLSRMALPDPDQTPAVHFCRISSDGSMEISSRTFHYIDGRLLLLYRYDYGNEEYPELIYTETPAELNDYFVKLLENSR